MPDSPDPASVSILGLSPGGLHRIACLDWGRETSRPPVLCLHGLTRNGRDFDPLATALAAAGRRVLAPDMAGRGRSDWLADPDHYRYTQYLADCLVLVARLGATEIDWVGTSMGGLVGMMLAADPLSPVRRLVLNDIGPLVPAAGLERIAAYVGADTVFDDLDGVEAHLRRIHAGAGVLEDEDWRRLARHGHRRRADGRLGLAHDPRIAAAFGPGRIADVDLWAVWDRVRCPVLVLRGAGSDLLPAATAAEMARRGPPVTLLEIGGCGHAPGLTRPDQIAAVREWLDA